MNPRPKEKWKEKPEEVMPVQQYRVLYASKTRKKSKYKNKTKTYNGVTYHSILEANYAEELDWRKKNGEVKDWKRQVKIPLTVNGVHIDNYFIDFIVELQNGSLQLVEVKGMELPLWIMKWRLLQALLGELYPGAEMIVIK